MLKNVTLSSTLFVLACAASISAHAIADTTKNVDVPAGELASALQELAKQSGAEFVYSADKLKGVHTTGVRGEYTTEKAVTKLLEGTKLKVTMHPSGALLISDNAPGAAASAIDGESSDQGGTEVESRSPDEKVPGSRLRVAANPVRKTRGRPRLPNLERCRTRVH